MNPSPRASTEAAQSPTSPLFMQSLSQRLRKGSSASRASSQSSDAPSTAADLEKTQDARSAKRYLLAIVRDDWEFPGIQPSHPEDSKVQREASNYRLREESLSEYESEDRKQWAGHEDNPYRFETPDDVSAMVERRKARKKRLVEQEMAWNDGLRTWTLRRDAWTGAVTHKPLPRSQATPSNLTPTKSPREHGHRNSSESTGRSSKSAPSWPLPTPQNGVEPQDPRDNMIPPGPPPEQQQAHPDGPYLPIYPPLIPASHILRSRIRPTAYPTIYSKVVILSLAPNVPIPLNHMIGALVDGWKAEGNWPPQPLEQGRGAARRNKRKQESAFQKWKREQEAKRAAENQQDNEVQWEQEPEPEPTKGVRRSISSAVKKMLGSGTSGHEQSNVDQDLERIGLTFESDHEHLASVPEALQNGHV